MDDANPGSTADLLLFNASVITFDPQRPRARWVAIRGDRILALGDDDDSSLFTQAGTKRIDCEGAAVIPGFNDAHCHPLPFAVSLLSVDCSPESAKDIAGIQACIRRRTEQTEEGKWIRAANYDEFNLHEKRPPTRWELDQAAPRHPVILIHRTAGNCVLNSLAMKLAGITRDTPNPPGGVIHRDPETGDPNGLISGRNELVDRAVPPIGDDDLERGMRLANREYLSQGITSLQDTGWNNGLRHWQTWQRLVDRGVVAPRVAMMAGAGSLDEFVGAGLSMGAGDSRLRLGGVKLALDESTGCLHPPQQDVNELALRACRAGFDVAFHVSDIPMLESALAAIKFVYQQIPGADKRRFRLEHGTICPPGLLLKIKASRAIVVAQPAFIRYMGQPYLDEAGPDQASWFQPFESFRRWGVRVAFSSDSPLVPSNPLTGIHAAVTRRTEAGQELARREEISLVDAIEMYTAGGAYASSEESIKGSISPGKLADLAVLNDDPARMVPEQIPELSVVRCIVNGRVVWD